MESLGLPSVSPLETANNKKRRNVRKEICKSICNSYYFKMRREEYIDVDAKEVRQELQTHHPVLHGMIYSTGYEESLSELMWSSGDGYEYYNPYILRAVRIGAEERTEYLITCLVKGAKSGRIKKFHVSQQYNANLVRSALPIMGRFIFSPNRLGQLELLAAAEEPAEWNHYAERFKFAEALYLMAKVAEFPSKIFKRSIIASLYE